MNIAVFGAGCFWCVEAIFAQLNGVINVESGYSNGNTEKPTYEQVCTGKTGYAEVCRITYDAKKITFNELLKVFFETHDPTTLNQQGADIGTQYRSGIYYINDSQKLDAEEYIKKITTSKLFKKPIVTEVKRLDKFYLAEDYHQNYYNNNKNVPYCKYVIKPKLDKLGK
tara:strand:+ start:5302 stop:5808 length:507 start_codon:yes stop_codon:yes gene_type:complete